MQRKNEQSHNQKSAIDFSVIQHIEKRIPACIFHLSVDLPIMALLKVTARTPHRTRRLQLSPCSSTSSTVLPVVHLITRDNQSNYIELSTIWPSITLTASTLAAELADDLSMIFITKIESKVISSAIPSHFYITSHDDTIRFVIRLTL